LFLWLSAGVSWRDRWRVLPIPMLGLFLSFLLYGFWPPELLLALQNNPPESSGSVSLWRWLGPAALLLWLPPLLLPLDRDKRLLGLAASTALTLPYFQQTDLLALFILPTGWLPLLGNLGYLLPFYGWTVMSFLVVVPLTLYLAVILPTAYQTLRLSNRQRPA
jgi:hypothetical protein